MLIESSKTCFDCYFADGSHCLSVITLFHKRMSVKAVVGKFQDYWRTLPLKVKYVFGPVYHC